MQPGEKGDLIVRRSNAEYGNVTNVPRRLGLSGFVNWGYLGTGPHDLALNVLYHYSDQNEEFARGFAGHFVEEVVSKLEMNVAMRIDGGFISKWVSERLEARPESSITIGELAPDHMAWDNDHKLILAPSEVA